LPAPRGAICISTPFSLARTCHALFNFSASRGKVLSPDNLYRPSGRLGGVGGAHHTRRAHPLPHGDALTRGKSFLVLFFKKERKKDLLFYKKKKQKNFQLKRFIFP
jgi:hypothetical protein